MYIPGSESLRMKMPILYSHDWRCEWSLNILLRKKQRPSETTPRTLMDTNNPRDWYIAILVRDLFLVLNMISHDFIDHPLRPVVSDIMFNTRNISGISAHSCIVLYLFIIIHYFFACPQNGLDTTGFILVNEYKLHLCLLFCNVKIGKIICARVYSCFIK